MGEPRPGIDILWIIRDPAWGDGGGEGIDGFAGEEQSNTIREFCRPVLL